MGSVGAVTSKPEISLLARCNNEGEQGAGRVACEIVSSWFDNSLHFCCPNAWLLICRNVTKLSVFNVVIPKKESV